MKSLSAVSLTQETAFDHCPSLTDFSRWIQAVFDEIKPPLTYCFNVHLVTPATGKTINFDYRQKNYATNVLSFAYPPLTKNAPMTAELIFCPEVIFHEARQENKTLREHWLHLTVHGTLHVLGFDHEQEEKALKMESWESRIISKIIGHQNTHDTRRGED